MDEMNKEDIKNAITNIFDCLEKESDKEAINDPLYQYFERNKNWFGDPEETYTMIIYHFNNIIKLHVKESFKTTDHLIYNIFTDWSLFDNNVSALCANLYGRTCSADKGRHIVKSAIKWKLTGELPVFDYKPENYHHPRTGTSQQWMNFIEGINSLKYGKPEKYLIAFKELMLTKDENTIK